MLAVGASEDDDVRLGTLVVEAHDGVEDSIVVGFSVGGFDGAVDREQVGTKLED